MTQLVIVRPLDNSTDSSMLGQMLSEAARGTDYYFLILPGRVDFEMTSKEQLQKLVDSIPDK